MKSELWIVGNEYPLMQVFTRTHIWAVCTAVTVDGYPVFTHDGVTHKSDQLWDYGSYQKATVYFEGQAYVGYSDRNHKAWFV